MYHHHSDRSDNNNIIIGTVAVHSGSRRMWQLGVRAFAFGFGVISVGYTLLNALLFLVYYRWRHASFRAWMCNPETEFVNLRGEDDTRKIPSALQAPLFYDSVGSEVVRMPEVKRQDQRRGLIRKQQQRRLYPTQWRLAVTNLTVASCCAGTTCACIALDWMANVDADGTRTFAVFAWLLVPLGLNAEQCAPAAVVGQVLLWFLLASGYQLVLEYWWHRWMHTEYCFRHMHRIHHHQKSPRPFDDMLIHPVEAFGYYCILYSPAFVLGPVAGALGLSEDGRFPLASFILYMILHGLCGILDHSGVVFSVPGIYETRDHDRHHSLVSCNYGFPFPFMDMLCGTFEGEYLGTHWSRFKKRRASQAAA